MGAAKTTRRYANSRTRVLARGPRWWLALFLFTMSLAAAFWVFTRDTTWETGRREEMERGRAALAIGRTDAAQKHFVAALRRHPYDWEAHQALASLLYHRLDDPDNAYKHYLYAMAYCPDPSRIDEIGRIVRTTAMLREGELESPFDAVADMQDAALSGVEHLFRQRLSPALEKDFFLFWSGWRRRGKGTAIRQNITPQADGAYDATVEVSYPDGTNTYIRLSCRRHDIWRLSLAFP